MKKSPDINTVHKSISEPSEKEVMEMCKREGLHQIDLLSPAPEKVTEAEFRAKAHGQKKLDRINKKIVQEGLRPAATTFQTQKDFLRDAIKECSRSARTFEEFQSLLLENYNISVISQRGRYRYLHPDRDRRITEKALGTKYGREIWRRFLSIMVKYYKRRKKYLRIIHQKRIITKIRLPFSIMAQNCVLLLICRQM